MQAAIIVFPGSNREQDVYDALTRAAGKLTDGLFIGIGTVIGLILGGVAVWKVWPWVDQITSL